MNMKDTHQYKQGYQAYMDCQYPEANPYDYRTSANNWTLWVEGYNDAYCDVEGK